MLAVADCASTTPVCGVRLFLLAVRRCAVTLMCSAAAALLCNLRVTATLTPRCGRVTAKAKCSRRRHYSKPARILCCTLTATASVATWPRPSGDRGTSSR